MFNLCCYSLLFIVLSHFSYVSRAHYRDSANHVILGTQQFKPTEFANQINLSMDNGWGILRCIIDTCMKLKEGKYLIMKDPNKVTPNVVAYFIKIINLGFMIYKYMVSTLDDYVLSGFSLKIFI